MAIISKYHSDEKITVKAGAIEKIIGLISEGNYYDAVAYLETLIDRDFRQHVRKTKEELYFRMKHSRTSAELEHYRKEYEDYMRESLF